MAGLKDNGFGNEVALMLDAISGSLPGSMVKSASKKEDDIDMEQAVAAASANKITMMLSKVASIADDLGAMGFMNSEVLADALIENIRKEAAPDADSKIEILRKELEREKRKEEPNKKTIEMLEAQLKKAQEAEKKATDK